MSKDKYHKLPLFHFAKELQKRHVKKNLRCVIFGNFGAHNLGDEAILAGQLNELQTIPNLIVTVITRKPSEIKRLHKVNAVLQYKLYAVRREIKRSDFVIIGGGGLINKIERSFIGFFYQLYMLMVYFYLPRLYRKKTYVLGIGIYDNANPFIVSLTLPLLKAASLLTVRDFHSAFFLKNKSVHASLYRDTSYLMPMLPQQQVLQDTYFSKQYRKERVNIGISLVKPEKKQEKKQLLHAIKQYIEKHQDEADFWFYPADYHPQYDHDEKFAKELTAQLDSPNPDMQFHFVPTNLTPQLFFSSFKLMDKMITMRFHAMLFAYRLKIPFAGIPYDTKCTSLLESIGKTALSLKTLTAEKINKNIL